MHVFYRQNQHQNEYQIIPRVSNSPSAILFVHISFIHLIIDNRASSTFGLVSGHFRLHVPVLPACMRARGAGSQITLQGQGLSSPNSAHQHCGILHVGIQLACGPCQSEHQRYALKRMMANEARPEEETKCFFRAWQTGQSWGEMFWIRM